MGRVDLGTIAFATLALAAVGSAVAAARAAGPRSAPVALAGAFVGVAGLTVMIGARVTAGAELVVAAVVALALALAARDAPAGDEAAPPRGGARAIAWLLFAVTALVAIDTQWGARGE